MTNKWTKEITVGDTSWIATVLADHDIPDDMIEDELNDRLRRRILAAIEQALTDTAMTSVSVEDTDDGTDEEAVNPDWQAEGF